MSKISNQTAYPALNAPQLADYLVITDFSRGVSKHKILRTTNWLNADDKNLCLVDAVPYMKGEEILWEGIQLTTIKPEYLNPYPT